MMKKMLMILFSVALVFASVSPQVASGLQQVVSWLPQSQPLEQFGAADARQPIAADLQNQVNALSAQLAHANKQLRIFQQQLGIANQQQPSIEQPQQLISGQPIIGQQAQPQQAQPQQAFQIATQPHQQFVSQLQSPHQQAASGLIAQQQHQHQQQQQQQLQQPQVFQAPQFGDASLVGQQQAAAQLQDKQHEGSPIVSTLADNPAVNQQFSQNLEVLLNQARQQQQLQQQLQQHDIQRQQAPPAQSTTASPQASIEQPSLSSFQLSHQPQPTDLSQSARQLQHQQQQQLQLQQQQQQQLQQQQQQELQSQKQAAPSLDQAPPHNPPKNEDKFSIGLGVLSPGYTQKFGNTALDFNQDKNGFSFTLSNNGHTNQPQQPATRPSGASSTK